MAALRAVRGPLLSEFVARERRVHLEGSKAVEATVASWNDFISNSGSIAGEYSSL
jgi:hypothetical protein